MKTSSRIAVVDYGMGNLFSVCRALSRVGAKPDVVSRPDGLAAYDKLVLPGVGAFGEAVAELKNRGLLKAVYDFAVSGKPFLGICLGMQLLMDKSEESKGVAGLGIVPGEVRRFSVRLKCPHMGWNRILIRGVPQAARREGIFRGLRDDMFVYFCHSYFVRPKSRAAVIGETDYGAKFASVIRQGNVYGMQFHPEKSQSVGLKLLKNFVRVC